MASEKEKEEKFEQNIVKIAAENLDNFLSEPASIVMEKLFAQRRTAAVSLRELKTLNDSGDIIKVSYNSKVNENSLEIEKLLNCGESGLNGIKTYPWRKGKVTFDQSQA